MNPLLKKISSFFIVSLFLTSQTLAQSTSYLGIPKFEKSSGTEYVSGNTPGTVLMKVNMWGAVNRPGIHHVPIKTDLMSLISYAGGPTGKAILDEVTIKREQGKTRKLIRVDVEELIKGVSHHHVQLSPNDIIVIPTDEPFISQDTIAAVGIISILTSTVLAAVLISSQSD